MRLTRWEIVHLRYGSGNNKKYVVYQYFQPDAEDTHEISRLSGSLFTTLILGSSCIVL
jgi:hypothetical protein